MPRFQSHHLYLPHFCFDQNQNVGVLYAMRILRDFVNKTVSFFIPIYIYSLAQNGGLAFPGLSSFQSAMVGIAGYFLILRLVVFGTAIPFAKVMQKIGLQRSFVIANVIYIGVFSLLRLSEWMPSLLFVAAFLDGFQTIFFWNSFHVVFTLAAKRQYVGEDLGLLSFFLHLLTIVSPALGGILIVTLGYGYVFLVAIIGILISAVLAFHLKDQPLKDDVSWKEFRTWLRQPAFIKFGVSLAGRYVNDALITVWPLYVFLLLGTVDRVGFLYALSLFLALLLVFFIGEYIDKTQSKRSFFLSGSFLSGLWLARIGALTPLAIGLIDMCDRISANFYWLFHDVLMIRGGKNREVLSYYTYREVIISLTGICFWTIFGTFFLFTSQWTGLFIFAAVGVLLSLLMTDHSLDSKLLSKDEPVNA